MRKSSAKHGSSQTRIRWMRVAQQGYRDQNTNILQHEDEINGTIRATMLESNMSLYMHNVDVIAINSAFHKQTPIPNDSKSCITTRSNIQTISITSAATQTTKVHTEVSTGALGTHCHPARRQSTTVNSLLHTQSKIDTIPHSRHSVPVFAT